MLKWKSTMWVTLYDFSNACYFFAE
ncbi:hypothetical protein PZX33_19695, partial [Klebsiella pneumoniae]|nr:hypothetical protein [Klebsiella pneumoniae]